MGCRLGLLQVLAPLCAVVLLMAGCSSKRSTQPEQPQQTVFPAVAAVTGNTVAAMAGVLGAAATARDDGSGAAVTIPAGTRVATDDPRYDTDGDGWADGFAVSLGEVGVAAAATGTTSADGGQSFGTALFVGGATYTPAGARFDPAVQLSIPVAPESGVAVGAQLDIWRFESTQAVSQVGGGYWALVGRGTLVQDGALRVVQFMSQRFGTYALSRATGANGAPTITHISADSYTLGVGESAELTCSATDPDGDTLSYLWAGAGDFTAPSSASTEWSADSEGGYPLSCTVSDGHGHSVTGELVINVTTAAVNLPPEIASVTATPQSVGVGENSSLSCSATDPESGALIYSWSGPGSFATPAAASTTWSHDTPGSHQVTCTVTDDATNQVSDNVSVTVLSDNAAPVIDSIAADPTTVLIGEQTTLTCAASDDDGDVLTYTWTGEGTFADAAAAETGWSHDTAGDYTLTCTVDDGNGGSDDADVVVTVQAPDETPPVWLGPDAGLVVEPREGHLLVWFNEASDDDSAPVSYTLSWDETPMFEVGPDWQQAYASYPAMPQRIDDLALGTEYTVGIVATDSAPAANSTALVSAAATPRPWFDEVPEGGHEFPAAVKFADIASSPDGARRLCVVWADPLSGTLRQSYLTDGEWVIHDISAARHYVMPQVFFPGEFPAIVAADDSGNIDLLQENVDGSWTNTALFTRTDVAHVGLDVLYDEAGMTAYVGHITEVVDPEREQTVHFLVVDLSGSVPTAVDQIDDYESAPYIAQVRVCHNNAGAATMVFSHGDGSFSFPNFYDAVLAFATYNAGSGFSRVTENLINPLYFDVRAGGEDDWLLAVTHGELVDLGGQDFMAFELRYMTGTIGNWAFNQVFTEELTLEGSTISYSAPLECVLPPQPNRVFYTRGSGDIDLPVLESTAALSLWRAFPPAESTEWDEALSRLTICGTVDDSFVLGCRVAGFSFEDVMNQLDLPGGNLVLSEQY